MGGVFVVQELMFELSIAILAVVTIASLILGVWMATIAFVYWDTRRRNLPGRQQFRWVVLSLLPFVGFIVYLLNRRGQARPSAPKKRVTMLKPQQGARRRLPTIVASEYVRVVQQNRQDLVSQVDQAPACVLAVTKGPHLGQEFVIVQLPTLIGRGTDATIRLDQDIGVSRQHAELYQQEGVLRLRDLNSTHGTSVNDQTIDDEKLVPGDTVRVGLSLLVVKRER